MIATVTKGFILGAGMIIPLGVQNSYVLSQSIKKNFHLTAATICILCDILLMSLGVFGGGALIAGNEIAYLLITWAGVAFLTVYGGLFFRDFLQAKMTSSDEKVGLSKRKVVIFTTLAVTLLNPHVYLDTVVIIGSVSGQYNQQDKWLFLIGTVLASLTWFYSLSLGAAKLSPWLNQPHVKRGINLMVALIMWFIAFTLVLQL